MPRKIGELIFVFLCVCLYFIYVDPRYGETRFVLTQFADLGQHVNFLVHALIILLDLCGILICLLHRNVYVKIVSGIVFALITGLGAGYYAVFHANIQTPDLRLLYSGHNFARDSLLGYLSIYLPAVASAVGIGIGLCLIAAFIRLRFSTRMLIIPCAGMLATWISLYATSGLFTFVPTAYAVPSIVLFTLVDPLYDGPRQQLTVRPAQRSRATHIILIVDESVRGDMLSVNGYHQETTPYLSALAGSVVNFGVASSATNCSEPSHLVLRTGLTQDGMPDVERRSLKSPDIFQFAQNAGFKTFYIDGQWHQGKLHSFMQQSDLDHIDGFYQFENESCSSSGDCGVAQKIIEILHGHEHSFIFAVKRGVHFHYENTYPATQRIFSPTLAASEPLHDRERLLNSYYNGIRWNVDRFFQFLIPSIEGRDYIMVYTSDHGQSILEGGGIMTHCQIDHPYHTQGNVPMMIFAERRELRSVFSENIGETYNHTTHFEIFPTLLWLFGYDTDFVNREYGKTLLDSASGVRMFYSGDPFGNRLMGWTLADGKLIGMGPTRQWNIFDGETVPK
jgi:glucan phosphoethanolaminetransferase (alkaline phosphatase superfamily)